MTTAEPDTAPADSHVPGETGVWVVVFGEVLLFSALFVTYLVYRGHAPAVFAASQRLLSPTLGMADTLVLLLSSLLVAGGLVARRRGRPADAARLVAGALACGATFSVMKIVEYGHVVGAGAAPTTNDAFMLYFLATGLHWAHLLVGMLLLAVVTRLVRRPAPLTAGQRVVVEGGACFWHMVDLLWIVIFPLLYLLR